MTWSFPSVSRQVPLQAVVGVVNTGFRIWNKQTSLKLLDELNMGRMVSMVDSTNNGKSWEYDKSDTLWLFNIAMENGPFIDGLPIEHCDFPWLC